VMLPYDHNFQVSEACQWSRLQGGQSRAKAAHAIHASQPHQVHCAVLYDLVDNCMEV
jgi:hypothetical protein